MDGTCFKRFSPVSRNGNGMPGGFEDTFRYHHVDGVIVDQQNIAPNRADASCIGFQWHSFFNLLRRRLGYFHRDFEPEPAAPLIRIAFNADKAAHQFHQLLGNTGAQAGPSVFSGQPQIRLNKTIKYNFLLVRGNADSGINDGKMKHRLIFAGTVDFHR